ncbi:MAG: hypothetical protein AAB421_00310 [Patescibacteria group bacterium]
MANTTKDLIHTILAVLVIALLAFSYYFAPFYRLTAEFPFIHNRISLENLQDIVTEDSIDTRIPTSEAFQNFKGAETGTKYKHLEEDVTKMEQDIASSAARDTEIEQLFKKAVYHQRLASLAVLIVDEPAKKKEMLLTAFNGLYDGLFRIAGAAQDENRNPRYVRRLYVYVIQYVYRNARDAQLFTTSKFANEKDFQAILEKFPLNSDLASTLYIDTLFSKKDLPRDKFMVSIKMRNLADLLNYPEVASDAQLKAKIVSEVSYLKTVFPTAESTQLTSSPAENMVRPLANYAISLGVLTRFDDSIPAEQVSQAFKTALTALDANLLSEEDHILFVKFTLDLNYAVFLFNQSGKKITDEVSTHLRSAESLKTKFAANREMTALLTSYLLALQIGNAWRDIATQDVREIARQDAQFNDFLVASGVKL